MIFFLFRKDKISRHKGTITFGYRHLTFLSDKIYCSYCILKNKHKATDQIALNDKETC